MPEVGIQRNLSHYNVKERATQTSGSVLNEWREILKFRPPGAVRTECGVQTDDVQVELQDAGCQTDDMQKPGEFPRHSHQLEISMFIMDLSFVCLYWKAFDGFGLGLHLEGIDIGGSLIPEAAAIRLLLAF